MKKILRVIVMVSLGVMVNAQSSKRYYCELVGFYNYNNTYTGDYNIIISINNSPFTTSSWGGRFEPNSEYYLVNKDGIAFTSMTGAANYMSLRGWQLLQVYTQPRVGYNSSTTHYVMYKDAPNFEKAIENIWIGYGRGEYGQSFNAFDARPLAEIIDWSSESDVEPLLKGNKSHELPDTVVASVTSGQPDEEYENPEEQCVINEYYNNGQKKEETCYRGGRKNKTIEYFTDGKVYKEIVFNENGVGEDLRMYGPDQDGNGYYLIFEGKIDENGNGFLWYRCNDNDGCTCATNVSVKITYVNGNPVLEECSKLINGKWVRFDCDD